MDLPAPYQPPRVVTDLASCYFYHTTDIPGYGPVEGEWDLRGGIQAYLGNVDLAGQRVLEIGTASGFVCFHMERQGAEVVAYDLSPEQAPDVVPFARHDTEETLRQMRVHIGKLNNAFWLCHRAFASKARLVHGTAYAVPETIGPVDVTTFGCVLLHLRDPFLALAGGLRLTRRKVIVCEPLVIRSRLKRWLLRKLAGPEMIFFPRYQTGQPKETWWVLSPEIVCHFLGVLGFEDATVSYHYQKFRGQELPMFTVVAERTQSR